jgi:hypothetical protein
MNAKEYIKVSNLAGLSYRNGFAKGTCNIRINNRDLAEYILQSLEYLRKLPF